MLKNYFKFDFVQQSSLNFVNFGVKSRKNSRKMREFCDNSSLQAVFKKPRKNPQKNSHCQKISSAILIQI